MLRRITAFKAVILMHFIGLTVAGIPSGGKPFPGLENLPRSFWHELSSPFTEVYEEESFATETGATPEPRPFFEDPDSNITVQLGAQVYLHCRVQNLEKRMVSWVRRRGEELHLLTFGQQTYSSDSRFSLDSELPNNWRLKLSSATERDSGVYECQVSAHPPLIRTVHLTVSVGHKFGLVNFKVDVKWVCNIIHGLFGTYITNLRSRQRIENGNKRTVLENNNAVNMKFFFTSAPITMYIQKPRSL
uniref:Ig-like domain-containing protein n=1 Tax=Trichogramma kaykai TaxID=54128 RepID=A0ABD2WV04_9HYME